MDTNIDELKLKFCICCLSRQAPFVNLDTCKHAGFLPALFENQVKFANMCVCLLCHRAVKKVDGFKRQVEKSWAELNGISATMVARSNNLAITKTQVNSYMEEFQYEVQVTEPKNEFDITVKQEPLDPELPEPELSPQPSPQPPPKLSPKPSPKRTPKPSPSLPNIAPNIFPAPTTQFVPILYNKPLVGIPLPLVKVTSAMPVCVTNDFDVLTSLDPKNFNISSFVPLNDGSAIQNSVSTSSYLQTLASNSPTTSTKPVSVSSPNDPALLNNLKKRSTDGKKAPPKKRLKQNVAPAGEKPPPKKRAPRTNYKKPMSQKYIGKIKISIMSFEEMMQERSQEAAKSSYQNLPFKCESCIAGFDHELTLLEHNRQKHTEVEDGFVCDICKSVVKSERILKGHRLGHMRRFECEVCGKRNRNLYPVIKHYNEQHGDMGIQYKCRDCDFVTDVYTRYNYHRDQNHSKRVKCELCSKTFVNATRLRIHTLSVHGVSEKTFDCKVCGKKYGTNKKLVAHVARHDAKPAADAYCEPCGTYFKTMLNLKQHLRSHSNHIRESDLRFVCNECGRKYTSQRALDEHVDWMHLKKIKHKCPTCSKPFINATTLRKHINFVHEKKRAPKNKICDYCGQGFNCLTYLRTHLRIHTGERPLLCPHCPATFAHAAALYTHKKLLHSGEKSKAKAKPKAKVEEDSQ